jgi:hypothetical protein
MAALHILFGRRAMRRERVFRDRNNPMDYMTDCEIGTTLKIGRKYDLRLTTFCEMDPDLWFVRRTSSFIIDKFSCIFEMGSCGL